MINVLTTNERYDPTINSPEINYEHWHRYLSVSEIVKNQVVLDIACGEGYGANILASKASQVIGIDIDEAIIYQAEKKYSRRNLEFKAGSATNFPIDGKNTFDIVVSFETIEHLAINQQKLFLEEVRRVLKQNGLFIVSTPNKQVYSTNRRYKNPFHEKEWKEKEFIIFLKRYFPNVKLYGQKIYPASFIWGKKLDGGKYSEYRLEFKNHRFNESLNRDKQEMMLIAICSNSAIKDSILTSLCLDLDSILIKSREEEIESLRAVLSEKERIIAKIHNFWGWKLFSLIKAVKRSVISKI